MNTKIIIKPATEKDYEAMLAIINNAKVESSVLKKTKEQLKQYNYFVAELNGKIIGTIGYKVWTDTQPEIISLVVTPECRGKKVGTKLVEECSKTIKQAGFNNVFALTTTPQLFEKLNWQIKEIKSFPEKIKCDCRECPRNAGGPDSPLCNEVAMYKNF